MLAIIIVLAIVAASVALIATVRRRYSLLEAHPHKPLHAEQLRPLFQPDAEELRAAAETEEHERAMREADEARVKKLAQFEEFRQTWRTTPDRMNTIELFSRAAELESGEVYLETVDEVLHERRPDGWLDHELADLIESHFFLLPLEERTPGAGYTITQELAQLRDTKSN